MKNSARIPASVILALTLACIAGCSGHKNVDQQSNAQGATDGSTTASSKADNGKEVMKTPAQKVDAAYRKALSSPEQYFDLNTDLGLNLEGVPNHPPAEYSYALVNFKGEDIPRLLVHATVVDPSLGVAEGTRVLSYDANSDTLAAADPPVKGGAGNAGGYRASVGYSVFGDGLLRIRTFSAGRDETLLRDIIVGDRIEEQTVYDRSIEDAYSQSGVDEDPVEQLTRTEYRPIEWTNITDLSVLDKLANDSWTSTIEEKSGLVVLAQERGLTTYTGTLRFLSTYELLQLQGMPNPNPQNGTDPSSPYAVLDLGGKYAATMRSSGSGGQFEERQIAMIGLAKPADDAWKPLNGKRVTVAVNPNSCWFPSDTSLPLGEPSCRVYAVLSAE